MNEKKDLLNHPEDAVSAGQLNAMGLIDEILHYIIYLYRKEKNPEIIGKAMDFLEKKIGKKKLEKTLHGFTQEFPPVKIYKGETGLNEYIIGETAGISHTHQILEEMINLWVANNNPAFMPYAELFDDTKLRQHTAYKKIMELLHDFFDNEEPFGPDKQNLIDMIRSPAIASPNSLKGQIMYIIDKWGMLIGKFLFRLLSSLDFIREEEKMRGFGKPDFLPYDYSLESEYERFSADKDWMPNLVLIAKHTFVWLDQLSRKYGRSISRLDQIPDEELDTLARWGFTGLWLIGLWERSQASKLIKNHCGNPDAAASAYSVYDYNIAEELGGYDSLLNLRDRCWKRGIRLASDMVPNHTGIYSKWIREHPDWFIQLPYPPFPSYSFSGHNYSEDPRVGVYIEDHYYNRSDAAVVFKRVDFHTGETRYIYHGNDGTHMPWNDTAQLDFLNPEVRKAVINTIIHVAKLFPIIRFDAAMTLAKKHYQRLWFPVPGSGGDIPSRAEHGMGSEDFNRAIPIEFWREVVDTVAREAPDTLLLAEAFWLMEGYFVRTLGMHRVYNSAFMNMLKMEDNQKYRLTIKNTMEFDPEILKRFVNFMNNPDEDTAVAQFGKDDKYFGVCIMMVTMPGLPMFGHGQIEGYTEKYGMEYRRAYWEEQPDWQLVGRHEREIFPLLKKRYVFTHVRNFLLYDFYTPEGWVNENVFAYSNRNGMERGLVIYNNKYEYARGWIRASASFAVKSVSGDRHLVQKSIGEGLALRNEGNYFTIFKDYITGLQYIRNSKELWDCGLYVELSAFKYHVFLDFREVCDNEYRHYAQLNANLSGTGVYSIDEELKEIVLKSIFEALRSILNKEVLCGLREGKITSPDLPPDHTLPERVKEASLNFYNAIKDFCKSLRNVNDITEIMNMKLEQVQMIEVFFEMNGFPEKGKAKKMREYFAAIVTEKPDVYLTLYCWVFFHLIGYIIDDEKATFQARSWMDEWLFGKKIYLALVDSGMEPADAWHGVEIIKILISHQAWNDIKGPRKNHPYLFLYKLFQDEDVRNYLQVNRFEGILWFSKERFDSLLRWLFAVSCVQSTLFDKSERVKIVTDNYRIIEKCLEAENESSFRVEKLLDVLDEQGKKKGRITKHEK
ncbi:MAG: alpha-amylase [Spirochaetales bacterium]|nr:alpha-amylase [Spirochaetales bacterium]